MAPRKSSKLNKRKRKAVRATIKMKKNSLRSGEIRRRVSDLATQYGMAKSTISFIMKNKEALKGADVKILAVKRSQIIEGMEKLLLV